MAKKDTPIGNLIPTRLLDPSERPPVPPAKPHSKRFRFFYVTFQLARLFMGNAWLRLRGKKTARTREERTIKCLQRLGMLWIRIAQSLTMRGAALSTAPGLRLLDLRDKGAASSFQQVRKTIEKELGRPMEKIFDRFEETPFSATTVSQLHRARLREEQVWTAVKVQQPLAEEIFDRDLKQFRRLVGFMKFFSIQKGMRWQELLHELKEIKTRELSYYYEAAALETLDKSLRGQPVHVPQIFRRYCSQRILVMEFIQGALLSDVITMRREDPERLEAWLQSNNINLGKVARRLFHSTFRQVFEDNFFHGDMNTNNIILMQDSNIAVIECRSAGSLEVESLEKQKMFLRSLADKEYVTAAEIYFLLASRLPHVDLNTVKERLVRVWRVWEMRTHIKNLPYEQKSLAFMTGEINSIVFDSQFAPLWSFTKLTCAWVHLDTAVGGLAPELNYLSQLKIYFRHAERRENIDKFVRLPSRLAAAVSALHQVPKRTAEYMLFRETLMRRQAQVVQGSASKLDAVIAAGFGMGSFILLVVGIFFLLAFSIRLLHLAVEPLLGGQLSWLAARMPDMHAGFWLVVFAAIGSIYRFFLKQKKRFGFKEFGGNNNTGPI
ncbi:MAG: AarF/ABC1/UbiB kinase family protein [bacterium]|nr:AarF/ABC1/UbiB kinase family protein [bacterium]